MQSRCAAPSAARAAARPVLSSASRPSFSAIYRPSLCARSAAAIACAKKKRGRGGADAAGPEPSLDELERYLREQAREARPGGGPGKSFDAQWKIKGAVNSSGGSQGAVGSASSSAASSKAARRAARALEAEMRRSGAYEDGVEGAYEDEDAYGLDYEEEDEEDVGGRRGRVSERSLRGSAARRSAGAGELVASAGRGLRSSSSGRPPSRRGVPAEVEYGYDEDDEDDEEVGDEEEEEEEEEEEDGEEDDDVGSPAPLTLYLDSADLEAVERFATAGLIYGVTTNPAILRKDGVPCRLDSLGRFVDSCESFGIEEVQLQTWGASADALFRTGLALARLSPLVVVKVPATAAGYEAAGKLVGQGVAVTLTAVHGVGQALAAASLGAAYVAPYVGRIGDAAGDADAGLLAAVEMHRMLHFTHASLYGEGRDAAQTQDALTCFPISGAIEGSFVAGEDAPDSSSASSASLRFRASSLSTSGSFLLGPAVPSRTEILAASVRSAQAALRLAAGGVRTMTLSPEVLGELTQSTLTDLAAEAFERDVAANS